MYTKYYGFSEKPFNVTPDPRFLYMSNGHREALASLTYGIQERRGFMVLVGEVGTGKPLLINSLCERLDAKVSIASLTNTDISFAEMLHHILVEFDLATVDEQPGRVDALGRLKTFANRQLAKQGNVAIIIDEAQNLEAKILEKIRLLSNIETAQQKLLQIILSGQPELDTILDQHTLRQFSQRVSLRRSIYPLNEKETYRYIKHHFLIINYDGPEIFNKNALRSIWKYSQGVPRKINILCDNVFLIGYALEKKKIKADVVEEAAHDLHWEPEDKKYNNEFSYIDSTSCPSDSQQPDRWHRFAVYLVCGIIGVVIGVGGWWVWQQNSLNRANIPEVSQKNPENAYHSNVSPETEKSIESFPRDKKQKTLFADNPAYVLDTELRSKVESLRAGLKIQTKPESQTGMAEAVSVTPMTNEPSLKQSSQINDAEEPFEKTAVKIVVKKGDTLSTIIGAKKYSTYKNALPVILQLNPGLSNPNRLRVGQVITLPYALAMKGKR
jgi:general secretion pathway protein A